MSYYDSDKKEESETKAFIPILINNELKVKLDYLSSNFDKEVGGWLTGEVTNGCIYLSDILMPTQEVSGTSVDINPADGAALLKEFKDKCKKILGHWHSHVKMGCFWSSTDEENMNTIMEPRDFFIFMVSSEGKHLVRVDAKRPFRFSVNNVPLTVEVPNYEKIVDKVEKELKLKVKEKTYAPINSNYSNGCSNNYYSNHSGYNSSKDTSQSKLNEVNINEKDLVDGAFGGDLMSGIKVFYNEHILEIRYLSDVEKNFIMGFFKGMNPESVYSGGCLNTIKVRIKSLDKAKLVVDELRDVLVEAMSEELDAFQNYYGRDPNSAFEGGGTV